MLSWKGKKSLKQKFHKHTTDIRKKEFKTKALQTYNRYKKKMLQALNILKKLRALYLAYNDSTADIQILDTQLKYLSKALKTKQNIFN